MSNEFFIFTHNNKKTDQISQSSELELCSLSLRMQHCFGKIYLEERTSFLMFHPVIGFWRIITIQIQVLQIKHMVNVVVFRRYALRSYRVGYSTQISFLRLIQHNCLLLSSLKCVLKSAANGDFSHMDRSKMSVILGVTSAQELYGHMVSRLQRPVWQKVLRENGLHEQQVQEICDGISNEYQPWQENTFPGLVGECCSRKNSESS